VNEIEDTTRNTYEGYIDRTIVPALGSTPIRKVSARVPGGVLRKTSADGRIPL